MKTPFSILVVGDTQYLFDGQRQRPELLLDTFRHIAGLTGSGALAPVRHVIHVGDVTEHGWLEEALPAEATLRECALQLDGVGMTIATGNHDVAHRSDDTRGPTPFLDTFGPDCSLLAADNVHGLTHGPGQYSSWRVIDVADDATWGVLALDWRPSEAGWRWADETLTANRALPTIVVSHETAFDGQVTEHGRTIEQLLAPHPQAFLVLGGHEWPSTRVSLPNREYHAVNHQQLPFGGAGAARIYEFDPQRGTCQVISLCPALQRPELLRSVAARRQLALSRPEDQFAFSLPSWLGGRTTPWQAEGMTLVADISPGSPEGLEGGPLDFDLDLPDSFVMELEAELPPQMSQHWQVLLTRLGAAPDGSPEPLASLSLSTENFIGWAAYTRDGETWANSHEAPPGATVQIVLRHGSSSGLWIDGDVVGRVDGGMDGSLLEGPWRWRLGAGEYDGKLGEFFEGTVRRFRAWA